MKEAHSLLVIFGISGDLATRKLLPALARIASKGKLKNVSILGVSRRNISLPKLFASSLPDEVFAGGKPELTMATAMLQMDIGSSDDYKKLADYIAKKQKTLGDSPLQILYYLSVPPSASLPIIEMLGKNGLSGKNTKLLLEKPFGVDLESAKTVIAEVGAYFDEEQVYRIDHYLAKEMAQNILVFRATNAIFSDLWNRDYIERIDIIASEKIGIEGRAVFYEQTGALRDIVQSHLMQLLALTLMETPNTLDWQVLPKLRDMALRQIQPISAGSHDKDLIRGQYEGYTAEVNNPSSQTETFVALTVFSDDPLWQGVPIRLVTGKALSEKTTEIRVQFKQKHALQANLLRLKIQPNEGVEIDLWAKRPGYERDFEKMKLAFTYDEHAGSLPDAYEQVIVDAIRSDKSLFASSDEVLCAWQILQPVQSYWDMTNGDVRLYKPGSTFESIINAT